MKKNSFLGLLAALSSACFSLSTSAQTSNNTFPSYQLFVLRFLLDDSQLANATPKKMWAGIDWQYWHNKFGADGVTESAPQLQFKYVC